jgi:hypothetical protein
MGQVEAEHLTLVSGQNEKENQGLVGISGSGGTEKTLVRISGFTPMAMPSILPRGGNNGALAARFPFPPGRPMTFPNFIIVTMCKGRLNT